MNWTPSQRQVYARCSARLRAALKAATDEQILDALAAPTAIDAIARLLLAVPERVYPHSRREARATSREPTAEDES